MAEDAVVRPSSLGEIVEQLKRIVAEELDVNLVADQIDANACFFEGGLGIDSIAIVELIAVVEQRFGMEFTDEDLVPESFASLHVLAGLIGKRLGIEAAPD